MKRVYVIMREREYYDGEIIEPYDVVSSMEHAEEICHREEARSALYDEPEWYYFWREVISSEG